MNKNLLIVAAIVLAGMAGYFAKSAFGNDLVYDYVDCVRNCEINLQDLKDERKLCIDAIPPVNVKVCLHVPPQNQAECWVRVFGEYNIARDKCENTYQEGLDKIKACSDKCIDLNNLPSKHN